MTGERVVRMFDYERKSREPDAQGEARDPADAKVIAFPRRDVEPPCDVELGAALLLCPLAVVLALCGVALA